MIKQTTNREVADGSRLEDVSSVCWWRRFNALKDFHETDSLCFLFQERQLSLTPPLKDPWRKGESSEPFVCRCVCGFCWLTPEANFNAKLSWLHPHLSLVFFFFRGCTDIICFILFIAVIVGYIIVGILGENKPIQFTCTRVSIISISRSGTDHINKVRCPRFYPWIESCIQTWWICLLLFYVWLWLKFPSRSLWKHQCGFRPHCSCRAVFSSWVCTTHPNEQNNKSVTTAKVTQLSCSIETSVSHYSAVGTLEI